MTWHIIYESRKGFVIQSPTGRQVMHENEKLLHLLEQKCEQQAARIAEIEAERDEMRVALLDADEDLTVMQNYRPSPPSEAAMKWLKAHKAIVETWAVKEIVDYIEATQQGGPLAD